MAQRARPPDPSGSHLRSATTPPSDQQPGPQCAVPMMETALHFRTVHGYRRAFRMAGEGPALLLIHGIGDSSDTWREVIPALARQHRVIAPDLLGHGASDKPRADYSVGGYANGMRDLLGVLGVDRVTLVGHSLGGGVAMQFAYQFPERTERLVLVSTGGVGPEVNPLLVLASLPGAGPLLSLLKLPGIRLQTQLAVALLQWLDTDLGIDAAEVMRVFDSLPDPTARHAFLRALRAVVDRRGQVLTMLDRCYLTRGMPTLLVWGARDVILPVRHAWTAHLAMPSSQLEVFEGAGHFPFHADPQRFVSVLEDFLTSSAPSDWDSEQWRALLRTGRLGDGAPVGDGVPVATTEQHRQQERALRDASERSAT